MWLTIAETVERISLVVIGALVTVLANYVNFRWTSKKEKGIREEERANNEIDKQRKDVKDKLAATRAICQEVLINVFNIRHHFFSGKNVNADTKIICDCWIKHSAVIDEEIYSDMLNTHMEFQKILIRLLDFKDKIADVMKEEMVKAAIDGKNEEEIKIFLGNKQAEIASTMDSEASEIEKLLMEIQKRYSKFALEAATASGVPPSSLR